MNITAEVEALHSFIRENVNYHFILLHEFVNIYNSVLIMCTES